MPMMLILYIYHLKQGQLVNSHKQIVFAVEVYRAFWDPWLSLTAKTLEFKPMV